uniref:Uncharacterized protein n=1 Tax=Anguilla anguilla TaxID=7936 RepID=A0A0E9UGN0_ANGAN
MDGLNFPASVAATKQTFLSREVWCFMLIVGVDRAIVLHILLKDLSTSSVKGRFWRTWRRRSGGSSQSVLRGVGVLGEFRKCYFCYLFLASHKWNFWPRND